MSATYGRFRPLSRSNAIRALRRLGVELDHLSRAMQEASDHDGRFHVGITGRLKRASADCFNAIERIEIERSLK